MFDDLRSSASFDEEEQLIQEETAATPAKTGNRSKGDNLFGMTAPQRFVIVLTLLFMVCALGGFCLILTDSISLPFF